MVGFSAPIAVASIAFATYAFKALQIPAGDATVLNLMGTPVVTISPLNLTAIIAIGAFTAIHYHSLRMGSRVQNLLTLFKVVMVVGFIFAGFYFGNGSIRHLQTPAMLPSTISAEKIAVSLIFVSFAYSGWNAAAYLGSEIADPRRNTPYALQSVTSHVNVILFLCEP